MNQEASRIASIFRDVDERGRIPKYPAYEPDEQHRQTALQVFALRERYRYSGHDWTVEELVRLTPSRLEKLFRMHLVGVTLNLAPDKYLTERKERL